MSGTIAPKISFEFFPPATPEAAYRLWDSAQKLGPFAPDFVSVTYGAGGTTRRRTLDAIKALVDTAKLNVAGHLTCVGASKEETLEIARAYKEMGVNRIVALRGDPPKADDGAFQPFEAHPEGFSGSIELIETLRTEIGLPMAVAAYPEPHPEAKGAEADIAHLRNKFEAGADSAITQFFFDNADYFRLLDAAEKAGIKGKILPGMLPIENFKRMVSFAARCGAGVPQKLHERFAKADTPEAHRKVAVDVCVEQCQELLDRGLDHIHIYTLNKSELVSEICLALGVEPQAPDIAAVG